MPKTLIKAAASYAEVEEALKAFLARHPEVSKDSSIARGAALDPILKGAIASMAYEGEGSLFDTMNYGSGNPELDRSVVADLTKTLGDLGCYYEQGHDWSLGVYPSDDTAEDAASRDMIDRLAAALGADADDLEVGETTQTDEGPVVRVTHGSKDYLVGDDMAFHAMAVERLKQEFDDDPENMMPESFMGWLDTQKVRETAETIAQELADSGVDELSSREKEKWLEDGDMLPEGADADKEFEAHVSEWTEERAKQSVGDDPLAYLEEVVGGEEEFKAYAVKEGLVDTDRMAADIASNDGFESVLGGSMQQKDGLTWLEM